MTERNEPSQAEWDAELAQFARQVQFHVGQWTVEEFMKLPEWGAHIELLDGSLLMTPGPGSDHQKMVFLLARLLDAVIPVDWNVLHDMNLKLAPSTLLRPDVLVVNRNASVVMYEPADVALAAEIVWRGSKRLDRKLRPDEYAAAGIHWVMLVELKGSGELEVCLSQLQDGAYVEHVRAHAGQTLHLTEPLAISFDPAVLLPR